MKFFNGVLLALCLIFYLASAEISEDDIEDSRRYCHNITATNEDETNKSVEGDECPANVSKEIKYYWLCFLKDIGWMDSDGNFTEKPKITPEPCWVKYGKVCMNATGEKECDKAMNFACCFYKNTKKEQATDKSCH